jgi:hypothetical protein
LGFDRSFDFLNGFHVVEIAGLEAALLAVDGVDAVVDSHIEYDTEMDGRVRGVDAVTRGIVISGTDYLLAADEAIVTGDLRVMRRRKSIVISGCYCSNSGKISQQAADRDGKTHPVRTLFSTTDALDLGF